MRLRKLGAGGLTVSSIGLGCMGYRPALDALFPLGGAAGTRYPEESMRLLNTP